METDGRLVQKQIPFTLLPALAILNPANKTIAVSFRPKHSPISISALLLTASVMDAYILFTFDLNKRIIYYFIRARIIDTDLSRSCKIHAPTYVYLSPSFVCVTRRWWVLLSLSDAGFEYRTRWNEPMGARRNHFERARAGSRVTILKYYCYILREAFRSL